MPYSQPQMSEPMFQTRLTYIDSKEKRTSALPYGPAAVSTRWIELHLEGEVIHPTLTSNFKEMPDEPETRHQTLE